MKIAPSMLASDFTRMGECAKSVSAADWLHLDIMEDVYKRQSSKSTVLATVFRSRAQTWL